jgi:hypothetical protein
MDGHDFDMVEAGALLDRVGMIAAGDRGFDSVEPGDPCMARFALSPAIGRGGRLSRPSNADDVRATFTAIEQIAGWIGRVLRIDFDNPEDLLALRGGVGELEGLLASCRRVLDDQLAALTYAEGE